MRNDERIYQMIERSNESQGVPILLNNLSDLEGSPLLEKIVFEVWLLGQNGQHDRKTWKSIFGLCNRDKLIKLGDPLSVNTQTLNVYRGVNNPRHGDGLSWSLSRDIAKWFANAKQCLFDNHGEFVGFPRRSLPTIYTAIINRSDVLFFSNQREEQEVVITPECKPRIIKVKQLERDEAQITT